jgi:hypothetical protein
MTIESQTRQSILSPIPEKAIQERPVNNLVQFIVSQPTDKIKCFSGRILSHWADNRTSTRDGILIWRILCAAGRFIGAGLASPAFGFVGTVWHTAAAVIEAAAFLLGGLIYFPTRLLKKSTDPQADWQSTLEKFVERRGQNAIKHLGSAYVDFMRTTGLGTLFTAFHFAAAPEDYEPNKNLAWSRKPSHIDTAIPALIYFLSK